MAASLIALAACDSLSSLTGSKPVTDLADPGPIAFNTETVPFVPPDRGRAVASVPAGRRLADPGPEIIVRGRESEPAQPPPRSIAGSTASGRGDITLNFAGADIRDVAQTVLGDMLKLNYVIDPDVSGPINFNLSKPVSRDELLPTFEAVLNSRGATMTQINGIVRVTALHKDGKAGAGAPGGSGGASLAARAGGDGPGSFTLRYVSASEMQKVLEKVLPPGQPIVADDKRHLLVVQGGPRELQLAADTVRIFDIDQLSGMSMALVPLRNAHPGEVTDELKNIFAANRRDAEGDAIRFMGIERLNAVMVLSRSSHYLDEARAWIGRLDRSRGANERRIYVYNLQYAKAAQVGPKLQGVLSTLDIQFKAPTQPAGDGIGADKPDAALTKVASTKPIVPAGAPAPEPPAPVTAASSGGDRNNVRIEADESHNALLISANPRDYELIRQVLEGIDVPPLQVLIEVTVAEVVLNDQLNYGVQYFINAGRTNTLLTTGRNVLGIMPTTPGFALSWITGNFQPRAVLDLLSTVTQTKVISTPRVLVLSNETARLQVGDVVPIITQSATSTITSNPLILNNVTYKETGVVLEVTPRVNAGGYVTMDVHQAVSDVVNTTSSTIDSPTFRQRKLNSTISVKSGESILLGGLIQQSDNRSSSGIPVLNEIPGFGALFGTRVNGAARTELIMLMTPHVIADNAQAGSLTSRVERQFQTVLDGRTMIPPRALPSR